jgi:serine phosphatase RsbU (regulator of sigma subunit)
MLAFLFSVLGILFLRFSRTRSQEERYASEFESARSVQQYLIPEKLPLTPGFAIESAYRPAREVGGDFFQVLPSGTDGSVLIVVGDVAGKGLQAGMLSALIVGAIRTAASFTSDPAKIITLLNERLQGRGLVTCLALRIENDGAATLVNAGHLPPYCNGKELPVEGSLPLGAISGIEFPLLSFQLANGDDLMLMSDGIAEAQKPDGELFGFDRISEMLGRATSAGELATAAQNFGQSDDITVLSITRRVQAAA